MLSELSPAQPRFIAQAGLCGLIERNHLGQIRL